MITNHRSHTRELGSSDEGQRCRPQWTSAEVQGSRKTKLRRSGILRHVRLTLCSISEPPMIKAMTDAELGDLITTEVTPAVIFPEFSCHTQAVERHVKLVTEAAKAVCGQKSRDGFIRARVSS